MDEILRNDGNALCSGPDQQLRLFLTTPQRLLAGTYFGRRNRRPCALDKSVCIGLHTGSLL
jgi:hypothetical protein